MKIKVKNMISSKGNTIANQFIITTSEGQYFQSYSSIIVFKPVYGKIKLDKRYWDFSTTTGKYRNMFLGETKKETAQKIKDGVYLSTNLN